MIDSEIDGWFRESIEFVEFQKCTATLQGKDEKNQQRKSNFHFQRVVATKLKSKVLFPFANGGVVRHLWGSLGR